ncbi:MAG: hypothetical protein EZS28_017343 [Streblomastix strix]|uniref:Uncharacterized protein n=2 Tax=Streblomastix strix TaxID=222440 RepID=A0A5J4VWW1_9EUKA|nr:MAG: hypothetical protein EZS28_017343 [Streblomastix strix]
MLDQINGYSQDIGQLQADVQVINTELARQTHFRGYFTTNDEIIELTNPAIGDYAYSAEDLLVWDYDGSQWIETDKIVPDQMTPASDANPLSDGTVTAGTSTEYSRGDHIHPLNISTSVPISDTADGTVGTSVNYARSDHSHPINISSTTPLQDSTLGSVGTANSYTRSDHQHLINVETNASNIPTVDGVGIKGSSTFYARHDHVHPQQLTYDGNVTATKFIKSGGTNQQILLADGNIKAITDFNTSVAPRAYQIDPADGIYWMCFAIVNISNFSSNGSYGCCNPNSSTGTLSDQWNIANSSDGQFRIGLGSQIVQDNKGLIISADGNTLSFNGSVIAGTGASTGASNGSVNYSAGNPILWGLNSVDTNGGFYSDGPKVYWRAKPVTLGAVPP